MDLLAHLTRIGEASLVDMDDITRMDDKKSPWEGFPGLELSCMFAACHWRDPLPSFSGKYPATWSFKPNLMSCVRVFKFTWALASNPIACCDPVIQSRCHIEGYVWHNIDLWYTCSFKLLCKDTSASRLAVWTLGESVYHLALCMLSYSLFDLHMKSIALCC